MHLEWLRVGIVIVHAALSTWAALLETRPGGLGWAIAPSLHWGITCKILGAVLSLHLVLDDIEAFFRDEVAIGPVASLELGEDEHTLVADLEGSGPWHLLEVWSVLVLVWHQVVVEVEWKILLRDLVFHDHGVGDPLDD